MNVTNKNMDVHAIMSYYTKMKENTQNSFLNQFNSLKEQSMKLKFGIPQSKEKKKPVSGVLVTGSTKPREIKGYITALKRKIDEIVMGDGEMNEKMARANLLQTKIGMLEKIMAQQIKQEFERLINKRKKIKDRVYLTKDDLTLNGDEDSGENRITGVNTGNIRSDGIGENFDGASYSNDVAVRDTDKECELDLEA